MAACYATLMITTTTLALPRRFHIARLDGMFETIATASPRFVSARPEKGLKRLNHKLVCRGGKKSSALMHEHLRLTPVASPSDFSVFFCLSLYSAVHGRSRLQNLSSRVRPHTEEERVTFAQRETNSQRIQNIFRE